MQKGTAKQHRQSTTNSSNSKNNQSQSTLRLFKDQVITEPDENKQSTTRDDHHQPSTPSTSSSSSSSAAADSSPSLSSAEVARIVTALTSLRTGSDALHSHLQEYLVQLRSSSPPSTANGNSLYEVKYQLLLHYLLGVCYCILCKLHGVPHATQEDTRVLDQLIQIQVMMERMRPIEKKMKYSIDKLLAQLEQPEQQRMRDREKEGQTEEEQDTDRRRTRTADADPLSYRANPFDLLQSHSMSSSVLPVPSSDGAAVSDSGAAAPVSSSSAYHPPQLNPVEFVDSLAVADRRAKKLERLRAKAASSSFVQSLYAELSDRPEERPVEGANATSHSAEVDERLARQRHQRTEFEEEHMVRLVETRVEKKKRRELERQKALETFDDFDELKQFIQTKERQSTAAGRRENLAATGERGRKRGRSDVDHDAALQDMFDGVEHSGSRVKGQRFSSQKGKTAFGGKKTGRARR